MRQKKIKTVLFFTTKRGEFKTQNFFPQEKKKGVHLSTIISGGGLLLFWVWVGSWGGRGGGA